MTGRFISGAWHEDPPKPETRNPYQSLFGPDEWAIAKVVEVPHLTPGTAMVIKGQPDVIYVSGPYFQKGAWREPLKMLLDEMDARKKAVVDSINENLHQALSPSDFIIKPKKLIPWMQG